MHASPRRANRLFAGAVRNVQVEKKKNRLKVPVLFRGTFTLLGSTHLCARTRVSVGTYQQREYTHDLPSRDADEFLSRSGEAPGFHNLDLDDPAPR